MSIVHYLENNFLSCHSYSLLLCPTAQSCVQDLSDQKADVFIARTAFSMAPTDQSALPFQALSQDGYFIISPYNCSIEKAMEDSIPTDITDSVNVFSYSVWNLIIVTFFTLSLLVSIHSILIEKYDDYGIWTVFNHFLMNPSFKISKSISSKLISLFLLISVFLIVVVHIKNIIMTDRVKMKEQKVYRSFADIVDTIENGVKLTILYKEQSSIMVDLDNPPHNYVRSKMRSYFDGTNVAKSVHSFEELVTESNKYDNIIIGGLLTTLIIKYHGCMLASAASDPKVPDTCLHRTSELEYTEQTINGIMVSNLFLNRTIHDQFKIRSMKNFEAGLRYQSIIMRGSEVSEPQIKSLDCLSESVNTISYDPGNKAMNIEYFLNGLYTLLFILLFAICTLILEILTNYNYETILIFHKKKHVRIKIKHYSIHP